MNPCLVETYRIKVKGKRTNLTTDFKNLISLIQMKVSPTTDSCFHSFSLCAQSRLTMLSCPSECWKHLSWQTWFTFIVNVWRERMVIDVFKAVLVSGRQCLWSQASLALAFLAHSMWLRAAGLAGAGQGAGLAGARCKAAQNLKRLFLWRRNASQIAQLHWVI